MTSRGAWLRDLERSLAEDQSGNELATALVVLASVAGQSSISWLGATMKLARSSRSLTRATAPSAPRRAYLKS